MPFHRLMLRVLVTLVTGLAMLHSSLEGSGVVCSSGSAERGAVTPHSRSHANHGAPAASMTHEQSDAAHQHGNQRAPAQERCCESMSSCGVATVVDEVERATAPIWVSTIPADSHAMLASVRAAPEPPPPKA